MKEYDRITRTHELWSKMNAEWRFMWQSYAGGDEYKRGSHLVRYQYETEAEYQERLDTTPLDNHCQSCINIYTGFLFRDEVHREYGQLDTDPSVESFLEDADLEGRTLDSFMKDVSIYSSIYGTHWVIVSKPQTLLGTRAAELEQGIRPYVSQVSAPNMLDWHWERLFNGSYRLDYIKYIEDSQGSNQTIKEWYNDRIVTTTIDTQRNEVVSQYEEPNGLGLIPAVLCYNRRGHTRGMGISDLTDVARLQKAIYNEYSEVEQLGRLSNHPTLVKTADVEASAGAGSIIQMPNDLDGTLKPYLLQPSGGNMDSLYNSIRHKVDAIDRLTNMGSVRATQVRTVSGVAMATEFEQLAARLGEKARNLELAEEQIWRFYALYQARAWDGRVSYSKNYNIRDHESDYRLLNVARQTATNPVVTAVIDQKLIALMNKTGEDEGNITYTSHIMMNPTTGETQVVLSMEQHQQLITQGWINIGE